MRDADMAVLPDAETKRLSYSPSHYYDQLEAGRTQALPNFALAAYVKDFGALGHPARKRADAAEDGRAP